VLQREKMKLTVETSEALLAHSRTASLEDEGAWPFRTRALLQRHGRAVTLGIALRHVRTARTQTQLLATIEEILVQHVGVESFTIVDASDAPQVLAARRVFPGYDAMAPVAFVPLGAGDWRLGALVIHRLAFRKEGLDAFDHDLLAALGPQIAVALYAVRFDATRPTVRPPRMPRPEEA
jgi:hypothetical protein